MRLCSAIRCSGTVAHPRIRGSSVTSRCETGGKAPALTAEQQEQVEKAMADPEVQKRVASMQEAMKNPAVQQQMAEMQSAMSNPQLQQRLEELKDDPEFKEMFEEIQTGGMGALMKYFNDPKMLSKLGSKMGDLDLSAAATPPPAPEVNDILDASRVGDMEAFEDFVAVGKDINVQDAEGRTPLHYATAHNHTRIVQALIEAGADLEKVDSKSNTPLHYACGYGRVDVTDILLRGGASITAENATGKKPVDLAALNEQNPVLQDAQLVSQLTP